MPRSRSYDAPDSKKASFDAQHYALMATYDPDRAEGPGVYWPYRLRLAATSLGLGITPAVDMPPKWFVPIAANSTETFGAACVIEMGRMQKGDGFEMFDLRTEGRGQDAWRRLRVMTWMIQKTLNNHEDYGTYLRITTGWVPQDAPEIWVPTPNGDFAVYNPSRQDIPPTSTGDRDDGPEHWVDDPLPAISPYEMLPPA